MRTISHEWYCDCLGQPRPLSSVGFAHQRGQLALAGDSEETQSRAFPSHRSDHLALMWVVGQLDMASLEPANG